MADVQAKAKRKADRLFSQLIRSLEHCEMCGRTGDDVQLQTAHWISRTFSHTRTDPDNAFCLCSSCHRYTSKHPTLFSDWAINKRGRATYERLYEASEKRTRFDWVEEVKRLEQMLEVKK